MDTTDSKIEFGPDGVCDHCATFYRDVLPSWDTGEKGRAQLMQLMGRPSGAQIYPMISSQKGDALTYNYEQVSGTVFCM